jgi:hypothetical protein
MTNFVRHGPLCADHPVSVSLKLDGPDKPGHDERVGMISEADRIEAVRKILIELYRLTDAGFAANRIGRVEREAIFYLYEGLDKYAEDKPHSSDARKLRADNGGKFPPKSITYDHAIPLASLRGELQSATKSNEAMRVCLQRFIRGVVITREEDVRLNGSGLRRRLPPGAAPHDMMARYRAVGVDFEPEDQAKLISSP